MKKFILILISCFSICLTSACSENEPTFSTSAVIFTRSQCQRTASAIDFFEELKGKDNNITYEIKDLSVGENRIMLKNLAKKYYLSKKAVPTPIIFTSKGFTLGWSEETKKKLKHQLNVR
jgi:arsenate reductase-like glutaredoxin family protein